MTKVLHSWIVLFILVFGVAYIVEPVEMTHYIMLVVHAFTMAM